MPKNDLTAFFLPGQRINKKKCDEPDSRPTAAKRSRPETDLPPTKSLSVPPPIDPQPSANRPSPEEIVRGCTEPNHADPSGYLPVQRLTDKTLKFQIAWFTEFPFLHSHPQLPGLVCFKCASAEAAGALDLYPRRDQAFISTGFSNWKNAKKMFRSHLKSECHEAAVKFFIVKTQPDVSAQISNQKMRDQALARQYLVDLVRAVGFLLRQGLATRGHTDVEANLTQLLVLLAKINPAFSTFLARTTNFTSPGCIEEIESKLFGLICDGTLDVQQQEQLSVNVRFVDKDLVVREEFLGLYLLGSTTADAIFEAVKDALQALGLDLANLRAQTYDGASNMTGEFNGVQAKIRACNPLALHFKCASHTINLVVQSICECDPLIEDALQYIHELGKLHKRSGKFSRIYNTISTGDPTGDKSTASIRPLCPTRFLCRRSAIDAVLKNYEFVLQSLYEMGRQSASNTTTKARGLYDKFSSSATLLGLKIAFKVTAPLEELNQTSQAVQQTVSGIRGATDVVIKEVKKLRAESKFSEILDDTNSLTEKYGLEPLELPRFRRPPKRYTGPAAAHQPATVEEHYRKSYYEVIDHAVAQLHDRLEVEGSTGVKTYNSLEKLLLGGSLDETGIELLSSYPEINTCRLAIQLPMFYDQARPCTLYDATSCMKNLDPAVRRLFSEVETLIRLLLVCPLSSCEAERSFSALRRLKTWLRSAMSHLKLNYSAVCHCHKDELDKIDPVVIAKEFASRSEIRENVFGRWQ